jgi:hypothetical protein
MEDLKIIVTHKELVITPGGWVINDNYDKRQVNIYFNKDIYIIQSPTGYQYEDINTIEQFQIELNKIHEYSLYNPMCRELYSSIQNNIQQLIYKYYNIGCVIFEIYNDIECLKINKQPGFELLEIDTRDPHR